MDTAPLVRMRWRLRGAWMWPSFIVLTLVDAVIINALPLAGDSSTAVGGWLLAIVVNLIAVVVLTGPLGFVVRRVRSDMPKLVARDYAGAVITVLITLGFLGSGLAHHHVVTSDRAALADAQARAESYIGARAPAAFQADANTLDTDAVQAPRIYRSCALNTAGTKYYCVVVNRSKPFGRSVSFSGSEPNELYFQGAN